MTSPSLGHFPETDLSPLIQRGMCFGHRQGRLEGTSGEGGSQHGHCSPLCPAATRLPRAAATRRSVLTDQSDVKK